MLKVTELVNNIFSSITYIIFREGETKAWLVDIGDIEPVVSFLREREMFVEGVFLTHGHFDHFYGLLPLLQNYPLCKVYATEYCKKSLGSDKMNLSKYYETPICYEGDVIVVHEGEGVSLFPEEPELCFYETPGHNPGCLTMVIGDMIFTGDSYIPTIGANTQLPHANKGQAQQSLGRIMELAKGKRVFPGHQI